MDLRVLVWGDDNYDDILIIKLIRSILIKYKL